eukprot:Mrub_05335.p1 GENE.Mrub_05335~~Mrub_05335.p1  ORF type:complete len:349 (+),score=45.23 Mrub_05335:119-1048(+)
MLKELIVLSNIFECIDKGLTEMEKNKLITKDNLKEINYNLIKSYTYDDVANNLFMDAQKLHCYVLKMLLFLLDYDKYMIKPSEMDELFEGWFENESYTKNKFDELIRIYKGIQNIEYNLYEYHKSLISNDIAAQNYLKNMEGNIKAMLELFTRHWYFAIFRRNLIDSTTTDFFKNQLNSNYTKQIIMLCSFKDNIKFISEDSEVLFKYVISFMTVTVSLITKLKTNMYKKYKNDYYTMPISNLNADIIKNYMFDDIERDGYYLKNSLGCLKETVDWIDMQMARNQFTLDSDQNKYYYNLIQEFVNDYVK